MIFEQPAKEKIMNKYSIKQWVELAITILTALSTVAETYSKSRGGK